MNLRQAEMKEWESIYNIAKKNGKLLGPVFPPEIRDHISDSSCLICELDNEIVGFCLYTVLKRDPTRLTIQVICVDEKSRGLHIASNMVKYIQNKYKRDIRTTCVKDSSSELFWASIGKKVEELPGKKRPICRYLISGNSNRRKLIDGI
jgi:ribosomal protein S18 acetylase RimI-like enzyme